MVTQNVGTVPRSILSRGLARGLAGLRRVSSVLSRWPVLPLIVVLALTVTAILGPLFAPYPATEGSLAQALKPPAWMTGGDSRFLLGTDVFGRDILSRIIYGSRISLSISLLAIFASGAFGTVIGLISGYVGGWVDSILMAIVDIALSFPLILMAIVLAAVLGPSYSNIILVIGMLLWPRYARQVRGEALAAKQQTFVAAARVAGASRPWILLWHIFPNVVPTLLVLATLQVGYVIILESSLSFMGVGIPPPNPSWGVMVSDGSSLLSIAWWISLFPGLAILVTVLGLNQLGDWVRDRLDPKLRHV